MTDAGGKSRHCPVDNIALKLDSHEGMTGFTCIRCDGAWFPHRCWSALQLESPFSESAFRAQLLAAESKPASRCCPDDGTMLTQTVVHEVTIDWCRHCVGIWFDKKELAQLRRYYQKGNHSSADTALAAVEVVLIGLSAWLS